MPVAPLDQCWQRAVKKPLSVFPHRDLPAQQPLRRHARGMQQFAAIQTEAGQRPHAVMGVSGAGHKVRKLRAVFAQMQLQLQIVKIKPAPGRCEALAGSASVNRDDLQIGPREGRGSQAEKPVVRSHQRMLSAGPGGSAQHPFAPPHAFIQRCCDHHQMVKLRGQRCGRRLHGRQITALRCRSCKWMFRRPPRYCRPHRVRYAPARRGQGIRLARRDSGRACGLQPSAIGRVPHSGCR